MQSLKSATAFLMCLDGGPYLVSFGVPPAVAGNIVCTAKYYAFLTRSIITSMWKWCFGDIKTLPVTLLKVVFWQTCSFFIWVSQVLGVQIGAACDWSANYFECCHQRFFTLLSNTFSIASRLLLEIDLSSHGFRFSDMYMQE